MTDTGGCQRPRTTGPRGGKTTVTESGLVRKTFALQQGCSLRKAAYEEERTETDIVRTALPYYLDIED